MPGVSWEEKNDYKSLECVRPFTLLMALALSVSPARAGSGVITAGGTGSVVDLTVLFDDAAQDLVK